MKNTTKKITKKVKKLTQEEWNKLVLRRNRVFNKLTKAQKRVYVAKDVIQQLEDKKLIANAGSYINSYGIYINYDEDIRENYQHVKKCEVCAMGACIMSLTSINNKLKLKDVGTTISRMNEAVVSDLLEEVFTAEQLYLIETAFEGYDKQSQRFGRDVMKAKVSVKLLKRASDHFKYNNIYGGDAHKILVAIMENIIAHKGTFKP